MVTSQKSPMQEHWSSKGANMSQIPSLMWAAPIFTEHKNAFFNAV
jgi:hypothetical protein